LRFFVGHPGDGDADDHGRENETATPALLRQSVRQLGYCGKESIRRRRKLSDQIMFLIKRTKMVAGIRERKRLRRSSARCMK
jgi:hypothetical protein